MRTYQYLPIVIAITVAAVLPSSAVAAPPVFTSPAAIAGTAAVGEALSCDASAIDQGALTVAFQWTVPGRAPGAALRVSNIVVPGSAAGLEITCTITISENGESATSAATVTVADAAPGINGPVHLTQDLGSRPECRLMGRSSVYGGRTTQSITWTINGVEHGTTLPQPIPFQALGKCTITVTNAFGTASASSETISMSPIYPKATRVPVVTGVPAVGSTLTCDGRGFDELLGWTAAVQWIEANTKVIGLGTTYMVPTNRVGASIGCRVAATYGNAYVYSAVASVVIGKPPVVTMPKIQPSRSLKSAWSLGVGTKVLVPQTSCKVASTLTIPAKLAKQRGLLPKKSTATIATIGSRTPQSARGLFATNAKFSPVAKRKLATVKQLAVTHVIVVTCPGGATTVSRPVKLKA